MSQVNSLFKGAAGAINHLCCVDTHFRNSFYCFPFTSMMVPTWLSVLCKLRAIYTMDHEVVPRPVKSLIGY
jgi:hypothetical protein